MSPLKTPGIVLGFIILLAGIKALLDYFLPFTAPFHDLFIQSTQLVLLAWLFLYILVKLVHKKPFKLIWLNVFVVGFFLILEGVFTGMLAHPDGIPAFCRQSFKDYYITYCRNIIQFEPYTKYDSAFFYRLRPNNNFTFSNGEYSNEYSTNNSGLRDDNASLEKPEILCLGDSYTLGWGVDQLQSFPDLIQQTTGRKVLNGAMSSFGTARELKRLTKVDSSALQYIIIQYCKNDADENKSFNEQGYLTISPKKFIAEERVATYHLQHQYYPGKHSTTILYAFLKQKLRNLIKGDIVPYYLSEDPEASAVEFVKTLKSYSPFLQNRKVLVIDLNDFQELNSNFIHTVDSLLSTEPYSNIRNSISTIDVKNNLSKEDFYILDAHLKPSGHQKIARVLSGYINR